MEKSEVKRKVKESLTLWDIIPGDVGRTAKLIRCPIPGHEDKNPSFSIFAQGKLGKCQSQCADLGTLDIIALHQKINGVGFHDALKALAEKAGIPFPGNGNGHHVKPLTITHDLPKDALDYLHGRGLTDETIKRFKLGYTKLYGKDGITIPVGGYHKIKFWKEPKEPKGKDWKTYPTGSTHDFFGSLEAQDVILCAGEWDTMMAIQNGFNAITATHGEGTFKPEYASRFEDKSISICYDSDKTGIKGAINAASVLHGIAREVRVITLPDISPGKDVSDFFNQGRKAEELKKLISEAVPWKPLQAQEKPTESPQFDLSLLESWNHIQSLEVHTEWIVDRLIPKDAINLIFGKGGIGKTWLLLDMARSIGSGLPFLGLQTRKTPVIFVDFENPLAVLNTRLQKLGDAENVHFWRANNEKIKAPKLDTPKWDQYKQLPSGAVLIFDTLRASHSGNENASDEIGAVMERLKELRDMGFTVLVLHHTSKNSSKASKGSSAIVDLADHILGLTLVKKKADGTDILLGDDEDMDEEAVYRFGVREKTRFEPYHVYLTLNPDRGFELAPDPQGDTLKAMLDILKEQGALNKTQFLEEAKERLKLSKHKTRKLFEIGTGRHWSVERHTATNNSQIVTPTIGLSGYSPPIGVGKPENRQACYPGQLENRKNKSSESLDNTGLSGYPDLFGKPGKPELREGVI